MPRSRAKRRATGSPACSVASSPRTTAIPTSMSRALGQAGLGMPDRDMYLLPDANLVSLRAGYLDHLTKMLTLAGETNAAARAKAIMDFETRIAKVSWTREDVSDATKTYNKMSLAQLQKLAPGFDWASYLKSRSADSTSCSSVSRPRSATLPRCPPRRRFRCSGPADRPVARRLCGRPAQGGRRREFRLLRDQAQRHSGKPAAVEARGRLHHQHPR